MKQFSQQHLSQDRKKNHRKQKGGTHIYRYRNITNFQKNMRRTLSTTTTTTFIGLSLARLASVSTASTTTTLGSEPAPSTSTDASSSATSTTTASSSPPLPSPPPHPPNRVAKTTSPLHDTLCRKKFHNPYEKIPNQNDWLLKPMFCIAVTASVLALSFQYYLEGESVRLKEKSPHKEKH